MKVTDDRGYGYWMLKNDFPQQTKRILRALLEPLQSAELPFPN
jgi:hypothetical protein